MQSERRVLGSDTDGDLGDNKLEHYEQICVLAPDTHAHTPSRSGNSSDWYPSSYVCSTPTHSLREHTHDARMRLVWHIRASSR